MPKVSLEALAEIEQALSEYRTVVETAPLADASKYDYTRFATAFVRWIRDEFVPGSANNPDASPPATNG